MLKRIDEKDKLLLFFAHFQPRTSFPEGGILNNNIDLLILIRAKGYKKTIFYKEHFGCKHYMEPYVLHTRTGMARDKKYLEHLDEMNCKFIPMHQKIDLINSKYVNKFIPITINGSIAIERALSGLGTIITGFPWWKDIPGVLHIEDLDNFDDLPEYFFKKDKELAEKALDF